MTVDDGRSGTAARPPEVLKEQEVVDGLYARLDELRSRARARLGQVRRSGPSGSPQNRSERDAFATLYEDRLAQLDAVEDRLVFGRLDLADGGDRYVGRIGLSDEAHASLLTDWRAPAAQAFYRATSAQPDGVLRRRHLVTRGRAVLSVEDEILDLDSIDEQDTTHLSGEGALVAAMAAGRTARMSDIVATIQAEQDRIIRSALEGALVVQGGPGTGKTAVALHRAAYLLYAHRRVLERSGVLLVGPSEDFLGYIDQVLPSLGETGVVSTTIGSLLPGIRATAVEGDVAARLKGDLGFARSVARAVRARQRVPHADVHLELDGVPLVIRRGDVEQAIDRARRTRKPHNLARPVFVKDVLKRLAAQYAEHVGTDLEPEERAIVLEDLRSHRDVRVTLNLAWFPITPQRLIEDLWVKPHRLEEAAPHLSAEQRAALRREPGAPWTEADIPLLDEAAELLGEDDEAARVQARADAEQRKRDVEYAQQVLSRSDAGALVSAEMLADRFSSGGTTLTTAERAASDRSWTYGHVIVDEAQELSAMAWRMLLRRCPTQSMTIVGDVAQTSSSAGTRSWGSMFSQVLRPGWRLEELTVNYRTPSAIAEAAQRAAIAARLPVSQVTSAREVPEALHAVALVDGDRQLRALVADALERHVRADGTGRVAVLATSERADRLRTVLAGAADGVLTTAQDALVVLDVRSAKGLEFDAVVLVEPDELAPSDLYVAMTRPTQRLVLVHSRDLPEGTVPQA